VPDAAEIRVHGARRRDPDEDVLAGPGRVEAHLPEDVARDELVRPLRVEVDRVREDCVGARPERLAPRRQVAVRVALRLVHPDEPDAARDEPDPDEDREHA
jgi:hypothetical protein